MTCEEWLRSKLQDWVLCSDVRAEARALGYTFNQLREARKKLGVETFHQFDEDGATENWFWRVKR